MAHPSHTVTLSDTRAGNCHPHSQEGGNREGRKETHLPLGLLHFGAAMLALGLPELGLLALALLQAQLLLQPLLLLLRLVELQLQRPLPALRLLHHLLQPGHVHLLQVLQLVQPQPLLVLKRLPAQVDTGERL